MVELNIQARTHPKYDMAVLRKKKGGIVLSAIIDNTGNVFDISDAELAQMGYFRKGGEE